MRGSVTAMSDPVSTPDVDTLEREHVLAVYDSIAAHFSTTRYKAWPRVRAFLEALPAPALIADVGCGNGKYFSCAQSHSDGSAAGRFVIGVDTSAALLSHAQRCEAPRTDLVRADGRRTALRAQRFDAALSIAVVHHFATEERRVAAIAELLRLVRPRGRVLVSVWAREQSRKRLRCANGEDKDKDKDKGEDKYKSAADVLVPWEMHERYDAARRVYQRYYHLFECGELERLVAAAAQSQGIGVDIVESYYDTENWCVILERRDEAGEVS